MGGIPSVHNVNFAQGFREPAQFGQVSGDPALYGASVRDYDKVMATWGQMPGGGFAGDETARKGYEDPRQGFETCGIVEYMRSFEILDRIAGNADRIDMLGVMVRRHHHPAAAEPAHRQQRLDAVLPGDDKVADLQHLHRTLAPVRQDHRAGAEAGRVAGGVSRGKGGIGGDVVAGKGKGGIGVVATGQGEAADDAAALIDRERVAVMGDAVLTREVVEHIVVGRPKIQDVTLLEHV